MLKKIIIWDLFGGGQNSVYKTIQENPDLAQLIEVYTFDITKPYHKNQFELDLAQENIIDKLNALNLPKPDIITASPLCQSFSSIITMKGGGTPFWTYNQDKTLLIERSVEEFEMLKSGFTKNQKADIQLFLKRLGEKCINNTIEIIEHYNPKFFYIENPKSSLMWKYITLNKKDFYESKKCHLNEAWYGQYGYLSDKPTRFLSNLKMELKKGRMINKPFELVEKDGKKWWKLKDDNIFGIKDLLSAGSGDITKPHNQPFYIIKRFLTLSGVNKNANPKNGAEKMKNEQTQEASPLSYIPHPLILEILLNFLTEFYKEK